MLRLVVKLNAAQISSDPLTLVENASARLLSNQSTTTVRPPKIPTRRSGATRIETTNKILRRYSATTLSLLMSASSWLSIATTSMLD